MIKRSQKSHRSEFCLAIVLAVASTVFSVDAVAESIISPDGLIRVEVAVTGKGQPQYTVQYRDATVISESRLGMRFAAHAAFDNGFKISGSEFRVSDNTWEQPWGERKRVRDHFAERTVHFESEQGPRRSFSVVVRVHNDGIGFRYVIPEQPYFKGFVVVDELTEFTVATDATAWWIPGRGWNRYEFLYRKTLLTDMTLAHTPATVRLKSGVHMSFHEAALVDYPAYVLDQRRDGILTTNLTPWSSGERARLRAPARTPWRTIQIAPDAVGLLNSSLILNLNETNKFGDVSWVEPGKYVGIWWAMHINERTWGSGPKHGATTSEAKRYIEFAAANGFDGVLVEGWNTGWDGDWVANGALFSFTQAYPDFDLSEVASFARDRDVRLVGHHETSGHISNYEAQISDAFQLYESLGVRQVKTGYVADGGRLKRVDTDGIVHMEWHDGQFAVRHFQHVLEVAAKHKISVNTHEPVKDTGLRRTYPNWISREGARGQEFNAWGEPPNPPSHTAILPYTRMLAGPMDFTPGIFDLTFDGDDSEHRVSTTLMKQLALYVVLYSPIQMAADLPENYARFNDAFQFIVDVPTDWEESIAIDGQVGEFVVVARKDRNSDDWYVGALTNERQRDIAIPLEFLGEHREYRATIYRDGAAAHWLTRPYDYLIDDKVVSQATTLKIALAAGGGTAIRLTPIDKQQAIKQ